MIMVVAIHGSPKIEQTSSKDNGSKLYVQVFNVHTNPSENLPMAEWIC
jgi:hypothetical protein